MSNANTFETEIDFEAPDLEDDPRHQGHFAAKVEVAYDPGMKPWRGSIWDCPSDVDWTGVSPHVEGIESAQIIDVDGNVFPATKKDMDRIEKWIREEGGQESLDDELRDHIISHDGV